MLGRVGRLALLIEQQKMEQNSSLLRSELQVLFWLGSWRSHPGAQGPVFCCQKIFLYQSIPWWVPGTVEPAGPEAEPVAGPALELVESLEIGALLGTSEVGLAAGTSDFELTAGTGEVELTAGTLEVVELAGISGVERLPVAGIFEVHQFAL